MTHIAFRSMEEVLYCFTKSSVKFQGRTGRKSTSSLFGSDLSKITKPVAAIKTLRFALLIDDWWSSDVVDDWNVY